MVAGLPAVPLEQRVRRAGLEPGVVRLVDVHDLHSKAARHVITREATHYLVHKTAEPGVCVQ